MSKREKTFTAMRNGKVTLRKFYVENNKIHKHYKKTGICALCIFRLLSATADECPKFKPRLKRWKNKKKDYLNVWCPNFKEREKYED